MDLKRSLDVLPKVGRVLLFQHRSLIHSGDDVRGGVKFTLRTDLMYKVVEIKSERGGGGAGGGGGGRGFAVPSGEESSDEDSD